MSGPISAYKKSVKKQFSKVITGDFKIYESDALEAECYSLNILIEGKLAHKISDFLNKIRDKYPNQYYYPEDRFHFTLLARIDPLVISEDKLKRVTAKILRKYPLKLALTGIGARTNSVSIPGYDLNNNTGLIRKKLREELHSGDDYTKFDPVWENIYWANIIRFYTPPTRNFFEELKKYENLSFGSIDKPKVQLFLNSSLTLDPAKRKFVAIF